MDCFERAEIEAPEAQKEAIDAQTAEFFARYREAQANKTEEQRAEEIAEMRSAFGPGETVVNIITGEVTKL